MHILNSYAKGVYSASDFFMKVHFKKRKKAGGTPVTVKQQKWEQGDLLLTGVRNVCLYFYSSYPSLLDRGFLKAFSVPLL